MVERDDFVFVAYDASKTNNYLDIHADYIIHGASNASPNMIVKEPVETMLSNFLGMKYLLDYAKEQGTKRILYISSSEVYGEKEGSEPYREGQYGYIDLLKARNSYSVGKRAAETLCASYADEYDVESVIVRPGHIYGPTASPYDNRVASAWAYSVARGEDIVMKSDGAQIRSYCYCLDCASAILKVLVSGENCHAYNISNPDSIISIKDMAEILVKSANVKLRIEIPTEEERKGFNPMSNSSLESTSLLQLGWHGCFDAETGFSHTVQILRETTC
jgi:nucleoside-diphosphate-sugar epimerase